MFDPTYPVAKVHEAAYNPRAISSDALEMLMKSITEIGFAKPIIVTQVGLIIAGHQRSKAARALNRETVPAWVLQEISPSDEIRFNQLHNGTDLDDIDVPVTVPASSMLGFAEVKHEDIIGSGRAQGATIRNEICKLVLRYGAWGCAVADESGRVLSSPQYAICCKILRIPCRVFYVPESKALAAVGWFGRQYGEFSYGHLPRRTWVQTLAQPTRLRGNEKKRDVSALYEKDVIPTLKKTERLLDFGCGHGDYVKLLRARGYNARGIEFFKRPRNGAHSLDVPTIHADIDAALADWKANGGFDVVVLDSVVTSTDTLVAKADVMACANLFAKPGGRVYIAGRRRERLEEMKKVTKAVEKRDPRRYIEFLDKDGFTALYRSGEWFYQLFLFEEDALALCREWVGPCALSGTTAGYWRILCSKQVELAPDVAEGALRREFNLLWPEGRSVGRAEEAVGAWRALAKKA